MILAAAQTKPNRGDINKNLSEHYELIELAAKNGAGLILFPEMSITGYERGKAKELAFVEQDRRLDRLKILASEHSITIVAGAPVLIRGDLFIGAFIIKPDWQINLYTKQYLHNGEEQYFNSSIDYNPILEFGNEQISFAICADIDNPLHARTASLKGTTLYIAGIFFTPNGMEKGYQILSGYANKYKMAVLMSNYCGQSWGINAGGQSAFWNERGERIAKLSEEESGLLLVQKIGENWKARQIV